ncbi:class I SAM-dependent methyltransferase [Pseudomonas entomophila]|uniref:class I SAM-dependent methyltransferase n=1 Tax=Pseudomonas entomophila TaxID=312306 RepID=UPI001BCBA083|nr:class I SAM-dependent methyltransferase [Pseudomonas entomophila]QVM89942.1 class I SAM-dependent methyltransferase [Pseudomonas entomophila]
MKVCHTYRENLYQLLGAIFQVMDKRPVVAELGVLRGENALKIHSALAPEKMVLIDSWSKAANDAYSPFDDLPPWVVPVDTYDYYYGGSLHDQLTWDRLYEECQARFAQLPEVTIIRSETIGAIDKVRQETDIDKFDLVYIDANHQYEYILRDLMYYQDLVAEDGFIMLNDCCHSPNGIKQNLGVLEALGSFLKRSDFIPVAMTNTDWSDVILVRKNSMLVQLMDMALSNSDVPYVEIPYQLITAARVVYGNQRHNISFT